MKIGDKISRAEFFAKHPDRDKKVVVFIDAEYVIQSLRNMRGSTKHIGINDIYWNKVVDFVLDGRAANEVIYYTSELNEKENPQTYHQQQKYMDKIRKEAPNVVIRLGKMQRVKIKKDETWTKTEHSNTADLFTWVQKGIDVKIVTDILVKASKNEYDIGILIAGDIDFVEAIKAAKIQFSKRIELVGFDREDSKSSQELVKIANKYTKIDCKTGGGYMWK